MVEKRYDDLQTPTSLQCHCDEEIPSLKAIGPSAPGSQIETPGVKWTNQNTVYLQGLVTQQA